MSSSKKEASDFSFVFVFALKRTARDSRHLVWGGLLVVMLSLRSVGGPTCLAAVWAGG